MQELNGRTASLPPENHAVLDRQLLSPRLPAVAAMQQSSGACALQEYALSFAQQRLWFLEQFDPGNLAYNYCDAIRLAGPLHIPALEQSLNEIVHRHEALRTVFPSKHGHPVQRILAPDPWSLPVTDACNIPESQRAAEIRRVTLVDSERPFDLRHGPLLRLKLLRFNERDHALIFVTHHIVFDGWSFGVFLRELMALYQSYAGGTHAALPELPLQYGGYSEWQRQRVSGEVLDKQLAYWTEQLAGLTTLALPLDRVRPATQACNGAHAALRLPPKLTGALRALCRSEKATIYMVLLAAFNALLHRYSNQADIVVGTPIAGRTQPQFEAMIGMFVNILVLRTSAAGNPTFRELLARVRETCLEAYTHQELPFDRLVEALEPERSPDRSPLFQVSFVLQNTPRSKLDIPGLQVSVQGVRPRVARFDLTLELTECADSIDAVMEYNTALFDEATIRRMLAHFEVLLLHIALNPLARIDSLPLLTQAERREVLVSWNDTYLQYPNDKTIHALIEEQAARTPNAIAVTYENQSLTYAELNARADALAQRLREAGVAPGVLAGICVERSPDMIVGVLAILKAGGAYVPMDPHYPAERLAYMIEDSRMPVLLTQQALNIAPASCRRVFIEPQSDSDSSDETKLHKTRRQDAGATDVAYCIYTSGSTGRPKGVQITHRAVVNFLHSMRQTPGIRADDVLLSVTTLSFDICGLEMFLPLIAGARVCLVSREDTIDGRALMRRLDETGASIMQATPSLWRLLLDSGWRGKPGLKALCGGEALPMKLAEQLIAAGVELWNMYGPTETTIWSSLKRIERSDCINIGRPIANTRMYILNAALQPAPIGVTGELFIGGDGVARGYLNRPELTAERFVADPFASEPGARMYKTGDQARYLANGEIQYLGRGDGQVKIRGHRIELGEIETALARHEGVRDSVVVALDDGGGNKQLAAYMTAKPGAALNAGELRAFLEQSLPEVMVPASFTVLEALPLTPNGKVDRNALPAPAAGAVKSESEYVPPQDGTERTLAEIWEEVLKTPRIGARDNFFELGGHSLLIFQVLSRVRDRFGIELPVRAMFDAPTIAKLAEMIENMRWANAPMAPAENGGIEEQEI